MFSKVLIANRGAIAVRVARTLARLDVRSLAVYAECDRESLHVEAAGEAVSLGEGGAAETYLDGARLLDIAVEHGADAVHPGYGFLAENATFARACAERGIAFVGPGAEHLELFGLKHRARGLAETADVPLPEGSGLLEDAAAARAAADRIGYPVMLKSTAGGGGIGMRLCADARALEEAFEQVRRLGASHFADGGVFVERGIARARHVEVQVLGDGRGAALAIGERDCSSQRRNQKVVEECPAPDLSDALRADLHRTAERLLGHVGYRNVGTVEFIVDADRGDFLFLEVNTRLQVEHGVTEAVYGVDLVELMLREASGEALDLDALRASLAPRGHAVQARLYAEDPALDFRPSAGLLTDVVFPDDGSVRVDRWVEAGVEVPPWFDPMLAKVIAHDDDRAAALARLAEALEATRLAGIATNLDWLRAYLRDPAFAAGAVTTRHLDTFVHRPARVDVVRGGTQTTVQDLPGRLGYWSVGVPPSGPFDALSFRLCNALLGNAPDAAGLELAVRGPALRFGIDTRFTFGGAPLAATLDGVEVAPWRVHLARAGQTLDLGAVGEAGVRAVLCLAGGIRTPPYLGSRSTFTLGRFGGHAGRALAAGDVLPLADGSARDEIHDSVDGSARAVADDALDAAPSAFGAMPRELPETLRPAIGHHWELRVVLGPHGAPDFFTPGDIDMLLATEWGVHYQSSRTGVRLNGPVPEWARADGGEAGLHPSNIHDNAYAFGAVDFTGDMPVILGPDGPSLGGFVCPATVIEADLWKLGQLRADDTLRFVPVSVERAVALAAVREATLDALAGGDVTAAGASGRTESIATADIAKIGAAAPIETTGTPPSVGATGVADNPSVLARLDAREVGDAVVYRAAGERFVLVEYGEPVLDLRLRLRAHALMERLERDPLPGIEELTPGIRTLQVRHDPRRLPLGRLLDHLQRVEGELHGTLGTLEVPSRTVHLPLSWDDEACREAIERYARSVRADAPWCPSNLEFIRRINGLDSIDAVRRIVFDAEYLVMGLGDVYLGAPVATPTDPRHRLVTTKYNPARTWTAENSVGIGGSYLCVYGMEGPGGYQFVGRTLQMWNRHRTTGAFETPWLLRFFDRLRFHPVSHDELMAIRRDFPLGRHALDVEAGTFSLDRHEAFLEREAESIRAFETRRDRAFGEELERWHASGQFSIAAEAPVEAVAEADWPDGATVLESPVSGSVWQCLVEAGQRVTAGQTLVVLESMKTEIPVESPGDGTVECVVRPEGQRVEAGGALVVLVPS